MKTNIVIKQKEFYGMQQYVVNTIKSKAELDPK